jgi:tetratricopeptide (TPR) repeat protein
VYKNTTRAAVAAAVAFFILVAAGCEKKTEPGADLNARARALYADGDYDGAVRLYDVLLVEYPAWAAENKVAEARKRARAKDLFYVARKAARSGRYEEAGDALNEALALAPDDVEVNYGIGWVYVELALQYQTKAQMTSGPSRVDFALLSDAHADLARERFERSIELGPKHWAGYRGMAVYHMYRGENDEALEALAKAEKYSEKAEDKIAVARLRIRAYVAQKNFDKAKETLDALVEKYPANGEAYFALGEYYLLADKPDPDEAIKAFEVGLTKDFEDEGTRNQMYVMLSRLRMRNGDFDGALAAIKSALATDPFNGVFTDEYAVAWGAKKLSEKRKKE